MSFSISHRVSHHLLPVTLLVGLACECPRLLVWIVHDRIAHRCISCLVDVCCLWIVILLPFLSGHVRVTICGGGEPHEQVVDVAGESWWCGHIGCRSWMIDVPVYAVLWFSVYVCRCWLEVLVLVWAVWSLID